MKIIQNIKILTDEKLEENILGKRSDNTAQNQSDNEVGFHFQTNSKERFEMKILWKS